MQKIQSEIIPCIKHPPLKIAPKKPTVFFYYHHFGGLGHGTRIYSLCAALRKLYPSYRLIVINSGKPQPEIGIEKHASVINLPFLEARHGLYSGLSSQESLDITFKKREKIIRFLTDRFLPRIAIFEHYPFGRDALKEEIENIIKLLRDKKTLIYSCVRDIITQPIKSQELVRRLSLFDGVFVHSDKKMGFVCALRHLPALKEKIILTGRLFPLRQNKLMSKNRIRNILGCNNKKLVVVSVGGGKDGFDIIRYIVSVKNSVDEKIQSLFLISAGPAMPETKFAQLNKLIGRTRNIILVRHINNFTDYIRAADLSISMGGYNSINNSLVTGTPTLVIPRRWEKEQMIRARYFGKFLCLDNGVSADTLADKILNMLSRTVPQDRYQFNFEGSEFTARLLSAILNLKDLRIRLTTRCNLDCDMCSWKNRHQELDFKILKKVIGDAALLKIENLSFIGGEATLYDHFPQVLRYAKNRGFHITVCTNGFLNRKTLVYLYKYADAAVLSIDSWNPAVFNKERGRRGALEKIIHSGRVLHRHGVRIHINATVRPDNYSDIHRLVYLVKGFSGSIYFHLVDTSENKLRHLKFKKNDILAFYLRVVPLIIKNCMRYKIKCKIQPILEETSPRAARGMLETISNEKTYRRVLKSRLTPTSSKSCFKPQMGLRINPDGEISPCCTLDNSQGIIGNVYEKSLLEILSSDKYSRFLKSAKPGKGMCHECGKEYKKFANMI